MKIDNSRAHNSIEKASDCVNGTWLEDLGVTDYNTITKKYLQHRYQHCHKPNHDNIQINQTLKKYQVLLVSLM